MLLEQQRQQPALPPGSATAGPGREVPTPLRQEAQQAQQAQPAPTPSA
jgi:vacuolar protein sorting-associated protein 26